jgi:hypothetical protein
VQISGTDSTGRDDTIDLRKESSPALSAPFDIPPKLGLLQPRASGRNSRNASMTGTSPLARVSDTSVWQLAVLPSTEAYCAATPTECMIH